MSPFPPHARKVRPWQDRTPGARPNSMEVGIFRDVVLDVPDRAWLEDVCVRASLSEYLSRADVEVAVESAGKPDLHQLKPDVVLAGAGNNGRVPQDSRRYQDHDRR